MFFVELCLIVLSDCFSSNFTFIKSFSRDLSGNFDDYTTKAIDFVNDNESDFHTYFKYVFYAIIGVGAVILVFTVLYIFGMLCGLSEKSCGKPVIITTSVFQWIASVFLLIIVIIGYIFLGAGHMYGCSQITAPDYKVLQLLDDANLIDIKTEIEKFLTYNQPLSEIPMKSILVRCETESLWDILELENAQEVQEITNFDVTAELGQIKTEISAAIRENVDEAVTTSFSGSVSDIDTYVTDVKQLVSDASNLDLNAEQDKIDVSQIRSTLEGAISALNNQGETAMANRLDAIKSNELVNIENTLPQLVTEIFAGSAEIAKLDSELITVETDFTDVQTYLNGLPVSIENDVLQYVDDLAAGIPNGLVEDISKALECDQFKINLDWFVFRGCEETAGQLHAVWFCGAWCIGIMPMAWFTFMCMVKHF